MKKIEGSGEPTFLVKLNVYVPRPGLVIGIYVGHERVPRTVDPITNVTTILFLTCGVFVSYMTLQTRF